MHICRLESNSVDIADIKNIVQSIYNNSKNNNNSNNNNTNNNSNNNNNYIYIYYIILHNCRLVGWLYEVIFVVIPFGP